LSIVRIFCTKSWTTCACPARWIADDCAGYWKRPSALGEQPFRYVLLDATYSKVRVDHRVVSQAVVVATGGAGGQFEAESRQPNLVLRGVS
jgi:hypothetical protein